LAHPGRCLIQDAGYGWCRLMRIIQGQVADVVQGESPDFSNHLTQLFKLLMYELITNKTNSFQPNR
jgi:hypothetical protein